jgi:hypothetical protein
MPTLAANRPRIQTTDLAPAPPLGGLPAQILERLRAEGVNSLDWKRLGRRRFRIFGVTRRVAAQLDSLARDAP